MKYGQGKQYIESLKEKRGMTRDEVVARSATTKTQNQKVSVLKELAARRLEMEAEKRNKSRKSPEKKAEMEK